MTYANPQTGALVLTHVDLQNLSSCAQQRFRLAVMEAAEHPETSDSQRAYREGRSVLLWAERTAAMWRCYRDA